MIRFQDIYGNEAVISHFQTALRTGNVSHAYLISGAEGSGKNMLADAFTAALLCREGGIEPCGKCKSCLQAESGNHPDIFRVTHEKTVISVNDIREQINSNVGIRPYASEYKVFIVDEAELMNDAAQNALLKTLEEPPEYVVIILLATSEEALLPTIRSRCILLNSRPLPKETVSRFLQKKYTMPDYQADVAAAFSGGNLGRAIEYATSQEALEERETILELLRKLDELTIADLSAAIKVPADRRDGVLDIILIWIRDVMLYKASGNAKQIILKDESRAISRVAETHSFEALEQAAKAVEETRQKLNSNVSADLAMEFLLLALKDREIKK